MSQHERPAAVVLPESASADVVAARAGQRPARWNGRTTAIAAAVAVGIATVGGGAVAYAAPAMSGSTRDGGPGGRGGQGGPGGMGGFGGAGGWQGGTGQGAGTGQVPGQQGPAGPQGTAAQQGGSAQVPAQQGGAAQVPGQQGVQGPVQQAPMGSPAS